MREVGEMNEANYSLSINVDAASYVASAVLHNLSDRTPYVLRLAFDHDELTDQDRYLLTDSDGEPLCAWVAWDDALDGFLDHIADLVDAGVRRLYHQFKDGDQP